MNAVLSVVGIGRVKPVKLVGVGLTIFEGKARPILGRIHEPHAHTPNPAAQVRTGGERCEHDSIA